MPNEPQELEQVPPQEDSLSLKDEVKKELKEEFRNLHQKRKRRIIRSVCIFALGVLIGFGGGRTIHTEHHFEHGHTQKMHHFRK
ncbi:hypothetical protein [Neobacillus sp. Marseille-QA0830]